MLKKILVASCLLVASMASQAGIIEYGGYKRDTNGTCAATEKDCKYNIVTGGGLEWLKWDVTNGLSINDALAAHGDRWQLASNAQMAGLFNTFKFGKTDWLGSETGESSYIPWNDSEVSVNKQFILMFGYTFMCGAACDYTEKDVIELSNAFFGSDLNGNGYYNLAGVSDDYTMLNGNQRGHTASFLHEHEFSVNFDTRQSGIAVALVRSINPVATSPVPLPGSISLLALGLVGLGLRRRQALRR